MSTSTPEIPAPVETMTTLVRLGSVRVPPYKQQIFGKIIATCASCTPCQSSGLTPFETISTPPSCIMASLTLPTATQTRLLYKNWLRSSSCLVHDDRPDLTCLREPSLVVVVANHSLSSRPKSPTDGPTTTWHPSPSPAPPRSSTAPPPKQQPSSSAGAKSSSPTAAAPPRAPPQTTTTTPPTPKPSPAAPSPASSSAPSPASSCSSGSSARAATSGRHPTRRRTRAAARGTTAWGARGRRRGAGRGSRDGRIRGGGVEGIITIIRVIRIRGIGVGAGGIGRRRWWRWGGRWRWCR